MENNNMGKTFNWLTFIISVALTIYFGMYYNSDRDSGKSEQNISNPKVSFQDNNTDNENIKENQQIDYNKINQTLTNTTEVRSNSDNQHNDNMTNQTQTTQDSLKESQSENVIKEKKRSIKTICTECNGNGTTEIKNSCSHCRGTGKATCSQCSGTGFFGNIYPTKGIYTPPTCSICSGTGISICNNCSGKAIVTRSITCNRCNGLGYYFSEN
jgi:DnaJ-class molecular chaperone with C-terminal Zn finger domain